MPFQKGKTDRQFRVMPRTTPFIGSVPTVSVSVRPLEGQPPSMPKSEDRQRGQHRPGRRRVIRLTGGRGHLTAFSTEIEEAGLILKGFP